jgi:outer membrane protein OmpA-like peptidoglycan-associated protein
MKHSNQNSEGIDQLFRSKVNDYEFPQEGPSWHLLQHLLAEQKKKKLLWRIRLFFASLATAGILLFFFFPPHSLTPPTKYGVRQSRTSPTGEREERRGVFGGGQDEDIKMGSEIHPGNPLNNDNTLGGSTNSDKVTDKTIFTPSHQNKNKPIPVLFSTPQQTPENNIINTADVLISHAESAEKNTEEEYVGSSSNVIYIYREHDTIKAKLLNQGAELNSPFPDYGPVINADGTVIYYTSRRPVTEKEKKKNRISTENIYYASLDTKTKKWNPAVILPEPVNVPGRFNSIIALSNDGQRMLLYRDDNMGNGDIYESVLNGTQWSEPQKLPEPINSKYHESSASISPDGRTIYFVSNRPGGAGKLDIWYATKDAKGNWSKAKNLGKPVNSPDDEEGIFIHPDGKTLYFSSRGHKGLGGYDIFYSVFENNKWSKPQNLGPDINTPNDDVYFVMEANGKAGYFSSIRKDGFGEKDIYRVEFIRTKEKEDKTPLLTLFKGLVIDKSTHAPLEAEIEIMDIEKNEQISVLKSNASTGQFLLSLPSGKNYGINVKKEGYLFYSENMNIPANAGYNEIVKTVLLDKLKTGSKIILKNIFYDYDKATLRPESMSELDRLYELLIQNPKLKVELSAHTDSRGSDEYNNKLSQERAQSCVDYLIKKGIDKNRIIAKGYGKQQLLISDEQIQRLSTEKEKEDAHQQNRRTEIKILGNDISITQ